jgi:osmotically inducible protein OsmC
MATDRTAKVTWTGSLVEGSGTIDGVGSGAFGPLDVTWASRSETPDERTSPEELIAAAWASCYSMALSGALARANTPPERLETSVTVTFQAGQGITKGAITVVGTVPGLDPEGFVEQAEGAKANCPVSKALTGIPEVTLDATLVTHRGG